MLRESRLSCPDVIGPARSIGEHAAGLDLAAFKASKLHQDAIIRQFLVLGVAAKRVDKAIQEQHPHIQWSKMIGMRSWLVHGYDKISLETEWHTASRFVPKILEQFEAILAELDSTRN